MIFTKNKERIHNPVFVFVTLLGLSLFESVLSGLSLIVIVSPYGVCQLSLIGFVALQYLLLGLSLIGFVTLWG